MDAQFLNERIHAHAEACLADGAPEFDVLVAYVARELVREGLPGGEDVEALIRERLVSPHKRARNTPAIANKTRRERAKQPLPVSTRAPVKKRKNVQGNRARRKRGRK